mgnify:CR=1 FL=1
MRRRYIIFKKTNGLIYGVYHIRYSINKDIKALSFMEIGEECDECLLEELVNIHDIDKVKEAICSLSINDKNYSDILLDSIMVILY